VSLLHEFKREEKFPSYFANRIQDYLSAAQMSLPMSASPTTVTVVPDPTLGIAAVCIKGRWRFVTGIVSRVHPGGAAGNYVVWAVAEDQKIAEVPKPLTDETNYAFELRITSGAEPAGVELAQKIAECHWTGAEIDSFHMSRNLVHGADLDQAAFSQIAGPISWTRERGGALVPALKTGSVETLQLANEAVNSSAIAALAIIEAKIAANAISSAKLAAGSVIEEKIGALAVSAAKIAAEAITEGKLANLSVSTAKIQALAVTAAKLAAEAVETGNIKNLAVTEAKIANEAITAAKLGPLSVTEGKLADGAASSRKIKPSGGTVSLTGNTVVTTAEIKEIGKLEVTPSVESKLLLIADLICEVKTEGEFALTWKIGTVNTHAWQKAKLQVGLREVHRTVWSFNMPAGVTQSIFLWVKMMVAGEVVIKSAEEWQSHYTWMMVAA
jgi:hypothetical protein